MYSWLEIDKNAITHNISQYKKIINNNILASVIKANAYGHGLLQIARINEQNKNIDWLCVSHLSDALLLREKKISKQILVLSCIDVDPVNAIHQNIDIVIGSYVGAQRLNTVGKQHNYRFNVHIKVDTGLSRLGIVSEHILEYIQYIRTLCYLNINGICSHFAQAQYENQSFTMKQFAQFNIILEKLKEYNIFIPYRHISNSAATILNQPFCNFFRVGIGMYGYWPSRANKLCIIQKYPKIRLKPALTWKTRIAEIKNISADTYIGYNCTYQTNKPIVSAILPIGYYDGYQRRFSNKAWVRIKDRYAPVIGRVCMNMTIIDVSKIPEVRIGDEAMVLGDYPKINAYSLADSANIDNVREIITTINPRIPRMVV